MLKTVKITYDDTSKQTSISSGGDSFDVSRIQGKELMDWIYPFIVKGIRWNGLYDELKAFLGGDEEFSILFDGSDKSLDALRNALKDTPVKVAGMNNKVVILYKSSPLSTKITVNGKIFDTSRIQNRTIDEWVYPLQFRDVKWDGIFSELENAVGTNCYSIQFVGEQADMKELIANCPENIDITCKAPAAPRASMPKVNAPAALSGVAAAGGNLISGAKNKIGNFTQNNENAQKAKTAAVNAGKKFDEGVTKAVTNIKNSEQYQKVMENEKVQKVMKNEKVQKFTSFWGRLDKKIKYPVCIVLALTIIILPIWLIFGGNTLKLEAEAQMIAMQCKHECDAGYVGFMGERGSYCLYFKAADHSIVYLVESEDGKSKETTASESEIFGRENGGYNFDTDVFGKDVDGDGYVEFTISEYTGFGYEEVCTILGEVKD